MTPQLIIPLPENRVRRNYTGGSGIDAFHERLIQQDTFQPEEWIGSLVEAKNPGLDEVEKEGLTQLSPDLSLKTLIAKNPTFYLGERFTKGGKTDFGFLMKILDSAMRLHMQAHPTAKFAQKYLNFPYGKLECYVILAVHPHTDPYIRLGFQKNITPKKWKEIIETQDISQMDALFEKIPVHPGEVWYIPGGLPHAIGEGITMLEVMEPSDLVVRCEFVREGIVVPPQARFMGKDLDFCLQIFDYTTYSPQQIRENFHLTPKIKQHTEKYLLETLVDEEVTPYFLIKRLTLNPREKITYEKGFFAEIFVVFAGKADVAASSESYTFKKGNSFLVAAKASTFTLENITDEKAVFGIVQSKQ